MTNNDIKRRVEEIKLKMTDLYAEMKTIQKKCNHPNAIVTTGSNFDTNDNFCPDCCKHWVTVE